MGSENRMDDVRLILEKHFGHKRFRKGQGEVIENILQGKNTIAVFPTGGGKSICYQIPALMLPGTSLVISPLISLMKDQVDSLKRRGVSAAYISSALSDNEVFQRIRDMAQNRYKIVYIAPERLYSQPFIAALQRIHIPMIAVDEAHCISQWGHNFRPAYLKLRDFITQLGNPTVAAFTATANRKVQEDMVDLLGLSECRMFIGSFDRENLELRVEHPVNPNAFLLQYIRRHPEKPGIIYAATRKNVEGIYSFLRDHHVAAGMYHGGLHSELRTQYQDQFLHGHIPVMVATNAFGMGINKSDVRYILHYNMPKSIENYYQEAGRAGRDGEKAVCILLKTQGDYRLNKFLIAGNYPPVERVLNVYNRIQKRGDQGLPMEVITNRQGNDYSLNESALRKLIEYSYVEIKDGMAYARCSDPFELTQEDIDLHKEIELDKLDTMMRYLDEKVCLRTYILRYFNEVMERERCGNCSVCLRGAGDEGRTLVNRLISNIFGSP